MVMQLFENRRSIRKFEETPVEEEKLANVLEAGRLAPSWANRQCWSFIVVKDKERRERISAILEGNPGGKGVGQAPVLIVACADPNESGIKGDQPYYLMDIGICLENMCLEAFSHGLGTCLIGLFDEEKVRAELGVPEGVRVVAMTPLGYPVRWPDSRGRKGIEAIIFNETWGQP